MKAKGSSHDRLARGLVVLAAMIAIASLVLMNTVSMADPWAPDVGPVPVSTPPPVQPAGPRVGADLSQRPVPVAIPTPPDHSVSSQAQGMQASVPVLLGLPALAALGLAALRLRDDPPVGRNALAARRDARPCQECVS